MTRRASALAAAALIAGACGDARVASPGASLVPARSDRAAVAAVEPDASDATATLRLAQRIRRAIVADEALSTPPRRIKVVASDRTVALRGAVDSEAERLRIAETARRIAGEERVTDELSVVTAGAGHAPGDAG